MPPRPCLGCGHLTTNGSRCGRCHPERERQRRHGLDDPAYRAERRRLRASGLPCHLCRRGINRTLKWPHPESFSVDHLTSREHGGTNAPSNLAPAHLGCNSSKGAG